MNGNDRGKVQISSREVLTVIFRRRVPIVICALIVTAAALSAASRAKSVYDGTTKVLLRRMGATALSTSWTPFYDLEEEMNTEVEIVSAEPVLARAAEILKDESISFVETVKDHRVTRDATADDLSEGVSAEHVEKSNIILVKFRSPQRAFAREAADAIAQAYVEYRLQVRKTAGFDQFFQDQIAGTEQKLIDLSRAERELRNQGGIFDLEWQQRTAIQRKNELQLKLGQVRSERLAEERKVTEIENRLKENPAELWPFSLVLDDNNETEMLNKYFELRRDRDEKASRMTTESPEVRMMDERLTLMEGRLRDEAQRRIRAKRYLIQDLAAEEAALAKTIAQVDAELVQDPSLVAQIDHLQKEIFYTYSYYDRLLEKMLEMTTSEANDIRITNAKIINPATVKLTKAGQMKTVYVAFSILLGITLGIGFGFLLESLDHSVKSAVDVEEVVGVPLLGSIPETRRVFAGKRRLSDDTEQNSQ